ARVQALVTGRVLEVLARPGEIVEPGHRLIVFDSRDLGAAKSDYAKAVADVERAEAAQRLARELFEVRAVPQKDVREADNDYRKSLAERERAAARLRTLGIGAEQLPAIASRADTGTRIVVAAPRAGSPCPRAPSIARAARPTSSSSGARTTTRGSRCSSAASSTAPSRSARA